MPVEYASCRNHILRRQNFKSIFKTFSRGPAWRVSSGVTRALHNPLHTTPWRYSRLYFMQNLHKLSIQDVSILRTLSCIFKFILILHFRALVLTKLEIRQIYVLLQFSTVFSGHVLASWQYFLRFLKNNYKCRGNHLKVKKKVKYFFYIWNKRNVCKYRLHNCLGILKELSSRQRPRFNLLYCLK